MISGSSSRSGCNRGAVAEVDRTQSGDIREQQLKRMQSGIMQQLKHKANEEKVAERSYL